SSRRRHTRFSRDWSSDVCSSDLQPCRDGARMREVLRLDIGGQAIHRVVGDAHRVVVILVGDDGKHRAEYLLALDGHAGPYMAERSEERRVGKECRGWWATAA